MGLQDDLERTKMKFIAVVERLIDAGALAEDDMDKVLDVFDAIEEMTANDADEEAVMAALAELAGSREMVEAQRRLQLLSED